MNNESFQQIAALVLVAIAATALIWRAWVKRKKPGCGGDCGCGVDEFKRKLKR